MTFTERARSRRRPPSRIPAFTSIEEEAAFWDTHSIADFEDELTVITDVRFVKARPKKGLTVRLEPETLAALSERAREKGVAPSTLARQWIMERLSTRPTGPESAGHA
jgi:hypothetical protein